MKQDAVLHIPMSEYCCGLDERRIVYRLRCARDDLKHVTLFYADTACRVNPILFTAAPGWAADPQMPHCPRAYSGSTWRSGSPCLP